MSVNGSGAGPPIMQKASKGLLDFIVPKILSKMTIFEKSGVTGGVFLLFGYRTCSFLWILGRISLWGAIEFIWSVMWVANM